MAQALETNVSDRPEYQIVSNDQSRSGSSSDKNAAAEVLSTKLWSDAYENMRDGPDEHKRELIITYEKVLTQLASNGKPFTLSPKPICSFAWC